MNQTDPFNVKCGDLTPDLSFNVKCGDLTPDLSPFAPFGLTALAKATMEGLGLDGLTEQSAKLQIGW